MLILFSRPEIILTTSSQVIEITSSEPFSELVNPQYLPRALRDTSDFLLPEQPIVLSWLTSRHKAKS
ncbi:mCG147409 [Mus musculus]|nr:mCG147409 [Mus musculus]